MQKSYRNNIGIPPVLPMYKINSKTGGMKASFSDSNNTWIPSNSLIMLMLTCFFIFFFSTTYLTFYFFQNEVTNSPSNFITQIDSIH